MGGHGQIWPIGYSLSTPSLEIIDSMDMSLSKFQEMIKDREAWRTAVHGVANRHNWTTFRYLGEFSSGVVTGCLWIHVLLFSLSNFVSPDPQSLIIKILSLWFFKSFMYFLLSFSGSDTFVSPFLFAKHK